MISVEEELIDSISAVFYHLRAGKIPTPIPIPAELPDNEIRQLFTFVNRFLVEFGLFAESMDKLAVGELDTPPLPGRMAIINSFKTLQSNLRHLTWKTQQIAGGDLTQQLNFMGDFSTAFNSMTQQLKDSYDKLVDLNKELDRRNQFIRKTFGRYTSDEIVDAILDAPNGLKLGGEKREVTLLMSDLRGFTALSGRLEASEVVAVLNHYLSVMVELIQQSGGNIDEIIGDSIFVIFGAPVVIHDAADRAVCCALEMQRAMKRVNDYNLERGWPEIEMGIALHSGEVVVGNIGSAKRSKYAVVGQTVNLTSRIESFTVGGQILVSPALMSSVRPGLLLGDTVEVHAKGMSEVLRCRELCGHEEYPDLELDQREPMCQPLAEPHPLQYVRLSGKQIKEEMKPATLVGLSHRRGVLKTCEQIEPFTNLMIRLSPVGNDNQILELYAKVISKIVASDHRYLVHFTSIPPETHVCLRKLLGTG
jgi:adenylate cyclase